MKSNINKLIFSFLLSFSIGSPAATSSMFKPATDPSNSFLQEVGRQFSVGVSDLHYQRGMGSSFELTISNSGDISSTIGSIVLNDRPDAVIGFFDLLSSDHWAFNSSPSDTVVKLSSVNEETADGIVDWGLHNSPGSNDHNLTSLTLKAVPNLGPDDFLPHAPMDGDSFSGFTDPGKSRLSFIQGASPLFGITLFVHDIPGFENQSVAFEFTGIPASVPEPESFLMLLVGFLAMAFVYRRRIELPGLRAISP